MMPARSRIFTNHLHTELRGMGSSKNLIDSARTPAPSFTLGVGKNRSKIHSNLD